MSLLDVLKGRKPLFRSTSMRGWLQEIETDFSKLINGQSGRNWSSNPLPQQSVIDEAKQAEETPILQAGARYTLSATSAQKVCDTRSTQRKISVSVLGVGQTAFLSHNRLRLTNQIGGLNEGIPVTSAGLGEPALQVLPWIGEMWAIGSADGVVIDVELL